MEVWRHAPEVDPAAVGMDGAVLDEMAARFSEAAEWGELFSGAQMAVYRLTTPAAARTAPGPRQGGAGWRPARQVPCLQSR